MSTRALVCLALSVAFAACAKGEHGGWYIYLLVVSVLWFALCGIQIAIDIFDHFEGRDE